MSDGETDIGRLEMRVITLFAALVLTSTAIVAPLSLAVSGGIQFGPVEDQPKRKPQRKPAPPPPPAEIAPEPSFEDAAPAATAPAAAPPARQAAPASDTHTPTQRQSGVMRRVSTKGLPPPPAPRNCKNTGTFSAWMRDFRKEAEELGISRRTISDALDGITLDEGVIRRDRRQGFFSQSFLDFQAKLATNNRVQNGRAQIKRHAATFERVKNEYGVQASVITGFWALESDFGAGLGNLPILRSLATLAYDCRRGPMFRDELLAALEIIDRGDMRPHEMVGSWAGEIGQTQFLPTRYLEHAVDYDDDGKPDLFKNPTDIIGTTANYMSHLGWRRNEPWLEEVIIPRELPWAEADLSIKHPRSKWAGLGVTRADGSPLENDAMPSSLLLPMGRFGPAFLAYQNFDVYLQWNQSLNYAITAAYLATRIDGAPAMRRGRGDIPTLSQDEAKELQRRLVDHGHDVGEIDGIIGAQTRQAVKTMQIKFNLPADSYPTPELLSALRRR